MCGCIELDIWDWLKGIESDQDMSGLIKRGIGGSIEITVSFLRTGLSRPVNGTVF